MVCYARAAGKVAAIALIVFLAFGRIVSHYLGEAAILVAITLATAGASIAAALAFAAFLSTRRNRAAGGRVSRAFRCQHAMTEQPRRLALVSSVDRRAAPPQQPERVTAPQLSDGPDRSAGPRWPDRPAYRSVPPRPPAPDRRVQRLRA
jgi:hypothetical protein